MNSKTLSRRQAITLTGLGVGAALTAKPHIATAADAPGSDLSKTFSFCLNTATIRGQKLGFVKEVEIAAKAGYQGIEPWIGTIQEYVAAGGTLKEMRTRLSDLGLTVESAIGFPAWVVDDDTQRAKGLEQAKREMDIVAQLGGKRLAAPPSGATNVPGLDLFKAADRYRALLEAADGIGVVPQLELWGFSKNLNRLGECAFVAIEAAHPKACVLADVYHIYKGGSDFQGLSLLGRDAVQVIHLNDYPAEPTREKINDGDRVFPGDGVGNVPRVLQALLTNGGPKVLSLEIFKKEYWEQDALWVARTGLEKMKTVARQTLELPAV
ncbi:MAG: sugar phosphate isomerase/epimerase [Verrucomicrobia bacterium]|nr:sugar phosphate isomerase/epimerase [Verrucomicrobiota bacterium]